MILPFKKHIVTILCMLFTCSDLIGQIDTINIAPYEHIIKDEKDGFKITETSAMYFDKNNRLWISGIYYNNKIQELDNRTAALQYFDGNKFVEIKIPTNVPDNFSTIKMFKRQDEQFYILLSSHYYYLLFLFNPDTLEFTKLNIPSAKNILPRGVALFEFQNEFIVFIRLKNSTPFYKLTDALEWEYINKTDPVFQLRDPKFKVFNDHFMLSTDYKRIKLFDLNGAFIKQVKLSDLNVFGADEDEKTLYRDEKAIFINQVIESKGTIYTRISNKNYFQKYDPTLKSWSGTKIYICIDSGNYSRYRDDISNDAHGNFLYKRLERSKTTINIFKNGIENPKYVTENPGSELPATISRNLEKEVIIVNNRKLHHIIFENKPIASFLKQKSIGGFLEINKNEFLVGTAKSGWFLLNFNSHQIYSYDMTLNGLHYNPQLNKKIIKDKDGYWSNDKNRLIFVNRNTKKITAFPRRSRITALCDDSQNIYYGNWDNSLMKFNKETLVDSLIIETDSLLFKDLLMRNKKIYAATDGGLLIITELEHTLIQPNKKIEDAHLTSFLNHPEYGILIGNNTGKIFRFNEADQSFETFYKDESNESITSILKDKNGKIWINSSTGIIAFNPKDKNIIKYISNDGLISNEANRHSAIETTSGHFIVGTTDGLNYFHPDSLYKEELNVELEFTNAQYYNNKRKSMVNLLSHKNLHDFKEVTLPPQNRNMTLNIGLHGLLNNEEVYYRYRLNNEAWVDLGLNYQINFNNMSPGDYKLEVEARDSPGNKLGNSLFLNIISKDFFVNTKWFYIILIFIILTFIAIYISRSNSRHNKQIAFSQDLIKMQEEERHRIAFDLHDGVAQQLALLARESKKSEDPRFHTMAIKSLENLRAVSRGLAPAELEEFGLTLGLTDMINEVDEQTDIFFTIDIHPMDSFLNKNTALHLYRIIQELLTNIVKHSQAKMVKINLKNNGRMIRLKVKDDGIGFNVNNLNLVSKSLGMRSIKERCNIINAKLYVNSSKGTGTETVVSFPIPS